MKRIALAALAALCVAKASAASADPAVHLLYARSTGSTPPPRYSYGAVTGYVEVQNIAYAKAVTVVYRVGDGAWTQTGARYVAPTHDQLEAWSFQIGGVTPLATVEFALRYDVAGETHWDSNGGANYRISVASPSMIMAGARVALFDASTHTTSDPRLVGAVMVKNLAYAKTVRVVYSTDRWATVKTADARYASSSGDLERWSFDVPLPASSDAIVQFAIAYGVDGQTYWDNDFGRDYALTY